MAHSLIAGAHVLLELEHRALTAQLAWLAATGQRLKALLADLAVYMSSAAVEKAAGSAARSSGGLVLTPLLAS
jgi:hypothetical protein